MHVRWFDKCLTYFYVDLKGEEGMLDKLPPNLLAIDPNFGKIK